MGDQIVSLAKELISVPSISGGSVEKLVEVLEIAKRPLGDFAFTPFVSNHQPSLLFSNQGTDVRNFKIILNAHLDVIAGPEQLFIPSVKNGKLYGRGAFDMKAAGAVMILLFEEMAPKLSFPFGLQLTTDEEVSGLDGTGYQIQQGVRTEFGIMGECNSNFRIGNQSKGREIITITTKGRAAHSAYAWLGKNAIVRMYEVLEPILKRFPPITEETYQSVVNITRIESGDQINQIPATCTAYIDIRHAPEEFGVITKQIKALLPPDAILSTHREPINHFVDPNNKYILALQQSTKQIVSEEYPLRFAHATSDAPYFNAVGCDAVEFGPIGFGAHQDDEYIDIQSLVDYYAILKNFLLTIEAEYTATKAEVTSIPAYKQMEE